MSKEAMLHHKSDKVTPRQQSDEHPGRSEQRLQNFLKSYPPYLSTAKLDHLRHTEYARLDRLNQIYLDYTGGGLYSESQIHRHHKLLQEHVFGNPHSANPASLISTELVERTRAYILNFFNADPEEYVVIFTANASGALKLVGESYPFSNGRYLLAFDNHNSVNGIREFAHNGGAKVTYVPIVLPDLHLDSFVLETELSRPAKEGNNLFAYPAQSNFSGIQHSLDWISQAKDAGWDVLLDAAAYVHSNRLDLSSVKPDFVPISFYKMFGYPTGVGVLIARKQALARLYRPWFAGGTITVASVQADKYYFAEGPQAFEDGTINYLSIPAVEIGLKHIESIGYELIHERVRCLTGWLLDNLLRLRHKNNHPLVLILGPTRLEGRGGTVTFHFLDKHGSHIDHHLIESKAAAKNISLRTGCFCNPGAGEVALGVSPVELTRCFSQTDHEQRLSLDDFLACIHRKSSGAIRVSVGFVTNFADVEAFLEFSKELLD
jgi:selenocysteine lyase/cysteine desulfurase